MSKRKLFRPPWAWWIRTGERMLLGIGIRTLLDASTVSGTRNKAGLLLTLQGVEEGQPVIASMKKSGMALPVEIWCLLETGEVTGHLGEALKETGHALKHRQETRRDIVGQLWYPALVFTVGSAVMALILFWVVPQMREVSESMGLGEDMPWLTENIGRLYGAVLAVMVGGFLLLAFLLTAIHRLGGRYLGWATLEERLVQAVPGAGKIISRLREARIFRQLGTLIKGGVTVPNALEMTAGTVSSQWIRQELMQWRSRLLLGAGFKEAIEACRIIDEDDIPLLMAGQESGKLDIYLVRISCDLQQQVSWSVKTWTRLLEPVMLLCLSSAIGGLVLAYLLPMVRMLEQAGGGF